MISAVREFFSVLDDDRARLLARLLPSATRESWRARGVPVARARGATDCRDARRPRGRAGRRAATCGSRRGRRSNSRRRSAQLRRGAETVGGGSRTPFRLPCSRTRSHRPPDGRVRRPSVSPSAAPRRRRSRTPRLSSPTPAAPGLRDGRPRRRTRVTRSSAKRTLADTLERLRAVEARRVPEKQGWRLARRARDGRRRAPRHAWMQRVVVGCEPYRGADTKARLPSRSRGWYERERLDEVDVRAVKLTDLRAPGRTLEGAELANALPPAGRVVTQLELAVAEPTTRRAGGRAAPHDSSVISSTPSHSQAENAELGRVVSELEPGARATREEARHSRWHSLRTAGSSERDERLHVVTDRARRPRRTARARADHASNTCR